MSTTDPTEEIVAPPGWTRNEKKMQWELYCGEKLISFVTDEFIARLANPTNAAIRLFNRLGSVPPPMVPLLPKFDPDSVVYDE